MSKYRLAIIGLGAFGKKYVETIQRDFADQIELVAACRQKNERPEWLPSTCQFYTDWRPICYKEKVDGVIIAASPYLYSVIKDLSHLGFPIMAEKPVVLDTNDLNHHFSGQLLVNYIHLFSPAFIELQNRIDLNKITSIETQGFNNGPIRDYSSLFDYGTHDLSMILSILQDFPTSIKCRKEKIHNGELFYIDLEFKNGITTHSVIGNGAKTKARKFIIHQSNFQSFTYDNENKNTYLTNLYKTQTLTGIKEKVITNIPIKYNGKIQPLTNSINDFLNLINKNVDPNDIRFGLQLTKQITSILAECEIQSS